MSGGMGGGMMGGGSMVGTITASEVKLEPQRLSGTASAAILSGVTTSFTLNLPSGCAFTSLTGAAIVTIFQQRRLADRDLLERALSNIVRNAVRYAGSAGPITVSTVANLNEAAIRISDRGPGPPESELDRIFDPFYRLEYSRSGESGGVGLGLAIVKSCVEASGGSVTCRNLPGGGLEVEILLKLAEAISHLDSVKELKTQRQ